MTHAIQFDAALIERYGGRGPRYTSYPTAAQFSDAFTIADYERHVAASNDAGGPLSIYVHVPYCRSLCYYCACNKVITRHEARAERYLAVLLREIEMQGAMFDRGRTVEQLHFGGGSPTYLSAAQLEQVMETLRRHFDLREDGHREFSIEVDPRTVGPVDLTWLAALGMNRLSLGVQDFDPRVQEAVNRIQPPEITLPLIREAANAGFESVSVDLIYGLPLQSVASFDRTLDLVLDARPDRIALYSYAHLPARFRAQRLIDPAAIPSPQVKLELLKHSIGRLTDDGYVYIGMDHFARADDDLARARENGTLQRNFQGYSTRAECDLIGLGPSAIGNVGGCYAQNERSDLSYRAAIEEGRLAVARGVALDADDRLRRDVIQALMCQGYVHIPSIERDHDIVFAARFRRELESLQPLADDGLVDIADDALDVTAKGQLLLRPVAMAFDRYLAEATPSASYSKVI